MKKISGLLMIALLITGNAISQNTKAPQQVKDAFKQKFPDAKNVSWEMEEGEWEAEFKKDTDSYSATFSEEGKWKETEKEITEKQVPETPMKALKAKYGDAEIEEISRVESEDGISYEFEIEQNEQVTEVLIDANGKILKEKKETEDDDEN